MTEEIKFRIYGKKQIEVCTDPLRRCYDGVFFSSKLVWTKWTYLGAVQTEEEAIDSVRAWKLANKKGHEYKYRKEFGPLGQNGNGEDH